MKTIKISLIAITILTLVPWSPCQAMWAPFFGAGKKVIAPLAKRPYATLTASIILASALTYTIWNSNPTIKEEDTMYLEDDRYHVKKLIKDNKEIGEIKYDSRSADVGYIVWLGIEPTYQGKGYGKKLAKHVYQQFIKEGKRAIKCQVRKDNHKAKDWYLRLGFKIIEENSFCYYLKLDIPSALDLPDISIVS